jgi:hypothetical protein
MLHIKIPYDPKTAPEGAPCPACGRDHPHEHEMIVVDALPIGPAMAVPLDMDPWAIHPDMPPPGQRRR